MNTSPPSEDSTKCTLASHRPLAKKSVLLPKHSSITRANNAEVIFSSKAGPPKKLLLYYCIGDLLVRPVGFFTGVITAEYQRIVPYVMRRSNGQIATVPFDPTDYQMVHDLKAIMEVNVAPSHTTGVVFKAEQSAKIFVYGEIAHGFAFVAPSKLELAGCLYLARWSRDGLIEEAVNRNVIVNLVAGIANVFVCDFREVVVMFDQEAKFTLTLQEAESDRQRARIGRGASSPASAGALSPTSMDSASPTPPSNEFSQLLLAAPQQRLAIEAPKMVTPAKETPIKETPAKEPPIKLSTKCQSDDKSSKTQSSCKGNQETKHQPKVVQIEKSGKSLPEPVSAPVPVSASAPVSVPAPVQVFAPVHAPEPISVPSLISSKPTVPVSAPSEVPESHAIFIAPKLMNKPKASGAREGSSKGEQPKAAKETPEIVVPVKEAPVKEAPVKLSIERQSDDKSDKTQSSKSNQEANNQSKVGQVEKSGKTVPEPVYAPAPVSVTTPVHVPEQISVPSPTPVTVSAPNDVPESQAIFIVPKPMSESKASETKEVSSKVEQPKAALPSTSSPVESPKSQAEAGLSLEGSMVMESAQELHQEKPLVPQASGIIPIQDTKPVEIVVPSVSAPSPIPKIPENNEQMTPKTADDPLVKENAPKKESNVKVASAAFMKPHSSRQRSKYSSSSSPVSSPKRAPDGSKPSAKSAQSKRDKKKSKKKSKKPKKSDRSKSRDKAKSKTPKRSSADKTLNAFVAPAATDNDDLSKSALSKSDSQPSSPKSPKSRIASKSTSTSSQATSLTSGSDQKDKQKKIKSVGSLQSIKTDARKAPIKADTVPSGSSAQAKSDHAKKAISPSKLKVRSAKSGRKKTKGKTPKGSRRSKKDKKAKTPSEATAKKSVVVKPVIKVGNVANFTINQTSTNEPKKGKEAATFKQQASPNSSGATVSSGESPASSPPPPPAFSSRPTTPRTSTAVTTTETPRNVSQRTAGEVLEALRKIADKRNAIKSDQEQVSQTLKKTTVKSPAKDVSITPTTSPTSFDRKDTLAQSKKKKTHPGSDLVENILKIRKSYEKRAKTGKRAKSASPSGPRVPRVASVDTLQKKQKAKAELEQLMRDLDNSSNKMTAIKSSHGSQEEMAPNGKGGGSEDAEKQAMAAEVESFRVKMGKVIVVLSQLVENITLTLREELLEDVALLQHCSDAMTPQQFDEYSARILEVAKKIDRLLGTFQT